MADYDKPARLNKMVMANHSTSASIPGQVRIAWLKFISVYPTWPIVHFLVTVLGFGLMFYTLRLGLPLLLVGGLFLGQWFRGNRNHLLYGDICPAVVLSNESNLIAVWTDMTKDLSDFHPAVRILSVPLDRCTGGRPPAKTRLAAVSLYGGNNHPDRWTVLLPILVACVTPSLKTIRRTLKQIPSENWQALKSGLRQVPRPFEPGLYFIEQDDLADGF